jgi:hypothetical protein
MFLLLVGKPKGVLHSTAGYMLYVATTFKYTFDHQARGGGSSRLKERSLFVLFLFRKAYVIQAID